jgi:hypothetical protein
MAINRKQEDLRDAIKVLVESGRLLSYSSGTHKTAAKFYSLNVPSGVDP